MTFSGTVERINQVLDGLVYLGNKDLNTDVKSEDTLTIVTSDLSNKGEGGTLIDTDTVKIKLAAINDAPVNTVPQQQSIDEDTNLVFNSTNKNAISISDINVNEGTGELEVPIAVTKGILSLKQATGLTFSQGNGTVNPSMTFKGKVTDINNALEGLIYRGNLNANGEDTLTITTKNNVPQEQTVDQYQQLTFSTEEGNAISVSDINTEEGTGVEVTLAVTQGVLTLGQIAGITFKARDGKANATMMFAGKVADINEALNSLVYQPNRDFSGSDRLTITISDLGNFGIKDIQIDQDTIGISVIPNFDVDVLVVIQRNKLLKK